MKIETVDVSWIENAGKPVRLRVRRAGNADETAGALAEAVACEALQRRGFRLSADGEAALDLTLSLSLRTLRDDRFLKPGTQVRVAILEARLEPAGGGKAHFARRAESKPEWGENEGEAVKRAVKDAWAVLETHLVEALAYY